MRWFKPKTLLATASAVILPLLALAYIASLTGKGPAMVILQVAIVVVGVVLFGLFVAKLLEQMNARRVGRWLATDEGKEWLESLAEDERETFLGRFQPFQDKATGVGPEK